MSQLIFGYHAIVLLVLLSVLVNFLLNQLAVPRLVPGPGPQATPFVSVLVPARNEEANISRCLSSLQRQDYPNYEIILLDDQSTDRTAEIALELDSSHPCRIRVVSGEKLPAGWVGKPWACSQLANVARGEYFLFTDADTCHTPHSLSTVMNEAVSSQTDLLTLWPAQETKTWSEKLVIPILFVAAAGMVPHWFLALGQRYESIRSRLTPEKWKMLGVANGQYILFSRDAYEKIGGHEAVKNHMVEDVSLGRLVASKTPEGMILKNCDGGGMVSTRMYRSFNELWEGFTKNAWPVFDGNKTVFYWGLSAHFLVFVGPFLWLPFSSISWLTILFQIALIYFIRLVFTVRYGSSWFGLLLHPIAYLLITAIAINSYRRNLVDGLSWKGRTYHVG